MLLALAGCSASKKAVTVTEEIDGGRAEFTYTGEVRAEKLQREVRFSSSSDTVSITSLQKGALHGELVMFHPNGQRKESVVYLNGIQYGPYKAYDTEGTLVFEGTLREGRKEGVWVTWYDATQKRQECLYENDVLTGKCTYWYIDGSLQREDTYRDGKLIASQEH